MTCFDMYYKILKSFGRKNTHEKFPLGFKFVFLVKKIEKFQVLKYLWNAMYWCRKIFVKYTQSWISLKKYYFSWPCKYLAQFKFSAKKIHLSGHFIFFKWKWVPKKMYLRSLPLFQACWFHFTNFHNCSINRWRATVSLTKYLIIMEKNNFLFISQSSCWSIIFWF